MTSRLFWCIPAEARGGGNQSKRRAVEAHADVNVRVHHGTSRESQACVTRNCRQINDIARAGPSGTHLARPDIGSVERGLDLVRAPLLPLAPVPAGAT